MTYMQASSFDQAGLGQIRLTS